MSFSYTPFSSDKDRVRFHIGDTDAGAPRFSDEEITALISEAGGWKPAVIACILNLMARLTVPNFTADWLTVDSKSAYQSLSALLSYKQRELGVRELTVNAVHVYRADGQMTDSPTFSQIDTEL